jgi:hypothetical protein
LIPGTWAEVADGPFPGVGEKSETSSRKKDSEERSELAFSLNCGILGMDLIEVGARNIKVGSMSPLFCF